MLAWLIIREPVLGIKLSYKIFGESLDKNPKYAYTGKIIRYTTVFSIGSNK